jgi:Leucine-rich repeat (LRR) protein
MKKLFILLALIATLAINAQAPQGFNYQATVRNSSGDLIVNQNVYFKFNLMQNSSTSVPIFTETHYVPTDDLGAVNLVIGQGSSTTGTFADINWGTGNYYLGIELNTGASYVAMGTTQLLSVPYALYANSSGNINAETPDLAAVLAVNNGANNVQIKNLNDPTDDQDAVTKSYLETIIANLQAQLTVLQSKMKTYVPDDNFEQRLIDLGYDDVLDGFVLTSNIKTVRELKLGLNDVIAENLKIKDLTGIQDFTALTYLVLWNNQLTSIDVSANTALTSLLLANNQLTSIDISANTALTQLDLNKNQLTSIDVSANKALTGLSLNQNQLTSIDVSANTALTSLLLANNQLNSIDVSANTVLTGLSLSQNQLTSIDVTANKTLTQLDLYQNQLTSIDVSANTALTGLFLYQNQLTSIDVSANKALTGLSLNQNQLTSIDVSANTVLTGLSLSQNQLTSIDVTANKTLTQLDLYQNQLTSIDVTANTALTSLSLSNNQLTSIDVSANTALTGLLLLNNQLTSIDVTANKALTALWLSNNQLTCIQVNENQLNAIPNNWFKDAGASYSLDCDLVKMLTANSSKKWRIKAEADRHFGLGPVGGSVIGEYYGAPANSKDDTGMYDDRYTFNTDGTFTHDTGVDGFVYGREVVIEELNGPGGVKDGADYIQYPYPNQVGQYLLSAPNNVETISLSGLGFIGYYTGGNHQYRIFSRSANEMVLSTADGNGEFEWWFVLVPE